MSAGPLTAVIAFIALAVITGNVSMGADDDQMVRKLEDTPKLTVRGEAELNKPADQLQIRAGVVTENREAAEALDENNSRMLALMSQF